MENFEYIKTSDKGAIIDRWMKYCWNYNSEYFKMRGINNGCHAPKLLIYLGSHFVEKWYIDNQSLNNGTLAMLLIWHKLDIDNQDKAVKWLFENYRG